MTRTLTQLANDFERVASLDVYADIVKEVSDDGLKLVREEFISSSDPYGNRWAPIKNTSGPRKGGPLYKTGDMRESSMAQPTSTGVAFSINTPYAAYQQPARKMLPTSALGVPQTWRSMIDSAFSRVIRKFGAF